MKPKQQVFYLVSTELGAGLTSVSLGLVRALDREGIRVAFYKPIHQPENILDPSSGHGNDSDSDDGSQDQQERSTHFLRMTGTFDPPEPFAFSYAEDALKSNEGLNQLLESVVEHFENAVNDLNVAVVVVEGLSPTLPGIEMLNERIASALDAQVILVANHSEISHENEKPKSHQDHDEKENHTALNNTRLHKLQDEIERATKIYGKRRLAGCIINKFNAPPSGVYLSSRLARRLQSRDLSFFDLTEQSGIFISQKKLGIRLFGVIPWNPKLLHVRTADMARHLGARVLYMGDMDRRRVGDVCLVARNVGHMVDRLRRDTLIITPTDREDILLAACMAELNGVSLAGVVLTNAGAGPSKGALDLCDRTLKETGLPVLLIDCDSYVAAATASAIHQEVPLDDIQRIEKVMDRIASGLDVDALREELAAHIGAEPPRMSPAAFMHQLVTRARQVQRRIVLPEGTDQRIIQAAVKCQSKGIAKCVLLGDPKEIYRLARAMGIVDFPVGLEIVEPTMELREKYVAPMVELRKHKGMTEAMARAQLEDITVLATMMLAEGEVDGLVSGAANTTANTIRPALQLIKARPDASIVSSVFFMLLPDQVVLYGDCAINPDPNPTELACIAIESAISAETFGIEPRIAMLSYSTGSSGKGCDVEKVRTATALVKQMRPDLLVDGPLQYDAASTMEVAKAKAPNSPVAGQATVLVFPDLNTGNTTYKAVQRTANVICVGPMLQGLRRPVNDLSRGALVDDIVYTIALTSIQADQAQGK
ncbi:hypothetical protein ACA910_002605 [Epithemia clementina (nom. ined.)]